MTIRNQTYQLLTGKPSNGRLALIIKSSLAGLILANVVAVIVETVPWIRKEGANFFRPFETISVVIFSIEYLLRLWSAPENPRAKKGLLGSLIWAISPSSLIDLLAILPSIYPIGNLDLRSIRMLRLLRIVRLANMSRYSVALQSLLNVVRTKAIDLLSLLILLMTLLIVSSTLMYFLECEAQPQDFSSIPASMWWGINTLTTVGYGDQAPLTNAGRFLGGIISILGIIMFALPAGLLGSAFVEELNKAKKERHLHLTGDHDAGKKCSHCGQKIA